MNGAAAAEARAPTLRAWLPWAILAWALAGTAVAVWAVERAVQTEARARLAEIATAEQLRIEQRMEHYVALLRGVAALFQASAVVTPDELEAYVARLRLDEHNPGIQGIAFTAYVPRAGIPAFEDQWRAVYPGFHVWPVPTAEYVTAIVMIQPLDRRNRAAIGFDMASERTRAHAMNTAVTTGLPQASGRVTLVQEIDADRQPGFLIYVPIYAARGEPATAPERWAALRGFAYGAFRAGDLVRTLAERLPEGVGLDVYDGEEATPRHLLHHDARRRGSAPVERRTVEVAGRAWTLVFHAQRPRASAVQLLAPAIGAIGAVLALLLVWAARGQLAAARTQRALADLAERERHRAEAAAELRERLLAVVSHDLRNPLGSIRMGAALLEEQALPPAAQRTAHRIVRAADRMTRLIAQLLDFAKLRQGQPLALTRTRVDLAELTAALVDEHELTHPDRAITLTVVGDAHAEVDGDRVAQLLSNLIGNALQHGAGTPVEIVLAPAGDRPGWLEVRVHNGGPPIPEDARARIFEPFAGAGARDPRDRNLGLGLYISCEIARAHGGDLRVTSTADSGTTFTLALPVAPPAA